MRNAVDEERVKTDIFVLQSMLVKTAKEKEHIFGPARLHHKVDVVDVPYSHQYCTACCAIRVLLYLSLSRVSKASRAVTPVTLLLYIHTLNAAF